MDARARSLHVSDAAGDVSALVAVPRDAWAGYVLAHGAGAGMRHAFLEEVAARLYDAGVATLRYQFPYMEGRKGRPDPPAVAEKTVEAAVACAATELAGLPLFAGGKSFGGRMTSQAASRAALAGVRGLVFLGFPLHAPKRPSVARAAHLSSVTVPMLFVQGTRDDLASMDLMREVCASLGNRAMMHVVEDGDHSFKVLKRTGRTHEQVMEGIRDAAVAWMRRVLKGAS
ncbi:MAG TPA: alpha/beta family hydrolase [Candidatus Krumholzibacteria bacterium]|nr:alpha/beta family hydrolase [Candidatus Krumholzibacteria bacterium]